MGIGITKWATQACTIPNGTTMVVMFVGWLCWGRHYFPYYSYHRNPTGREFFVPEPIVVVKLLREEMGGSGNYDGGELIFNRPTLGQHQQYLICLIRS